MIDFKYFLPFFLLLAIFTQTSYAQESDSLQLQKEYILNTPQEINSDFEALHNYLVAKAEDQDTRLHRFFLWITHNIRYDNFAAKSIELKSRKTSIAETLKNKKAICTGYAQLLQAFCKKSAIPCLVITGYTKGLSNPKPKLEETDHAWNAVKINDQWQLIDVTWSAGITQNPQGFPNKTPGYYFLSPPEQMILDHLPADPMWQLLDCPITRAQFRGTPEEVNNFLQNSKPCYSLKDSLDLFENLTTDLQNIKSLERAYYFNPSKPNGAELGHYYMDQFILLSEQEKQLQEQEDWNGLLQLYPRLFKFADKAEKFTPLYHWQKENIAYSYINYVVALSRNVPPSSRKKSLTEMNHCLLKAQGILQKVPTNPFVEQGLQACVKYLSFTREQLEAD